MSMTPKSSEQPLRWRSEVRPSDPEAVRRVVASTNFFTAAEIEIAVELVVERLAKGLASGYRFVFAESTGAAGPVVGYSCFGEIPCTVGSYDLYWIAVDASAQRGGLGRRILEQSEREMRALAGRRVYIETSGRELYRPTQQFYLRCGYRLEAELADFYAAGDPKQIYVKALAG